MKKIVFITFIMLFSTIIINAQEDKKEKLYVQLKEGAKPTIYVDDKVFDFPLELINQERIASIFVVKGEEAIKKYNAPNGVILIKTKDSDAATTTKLEATNLKTGATTKLKIIENGKEVGGKKQPMIIVDGKVTDRKVLDELETYQIKKMQVLKGEEALKLYDAPNGVIIITTKK